MLSTQEFEELEERCRKGKAWIEAHGGWGGNITPPFDFNRHTPKTKLQQAIKLWHTLQQEWLKEFVLRQPRETEKKSSQGWHIMKRNEAIEKWKHTVKAKRGPDPRTLPLETFR